jgi:signal transduction histidine kinase
VKAPSFAVASHRTSLAAWWVAAVVASLLVLAAAVQFGRNPAARLAYTDGPTDLYAFATGVVTTAGAIVLVAGGLAWWRQRPTYLTGPLMVALSADWALVQATTWTFRPWALAVHTLAVLPLRPLQFWLILAWPGGRLRRGDRRLLLWFTAVQSLLWMIKAASGGTNENPNPFGRFDSTDVWFTVLRFYALVLLPLMAVAVLVIVVRRWRALPTSLRHLGTPPMAAAAITAIAYVVVIPLEMFVDGLFFAQGGLTLAGLVAALVEFGQFLFIGLVLSLGGLRLRSSGTSVRMRFVEVGATTPRRTANELLAAGTGDRDARVRYPYDGAWVDATGAPLPASVGTDRTVTRLERDGETLAAFELDQSLEDRPSVVESAAAITAVALEHERLESLALAQLADLERLRAAIIEAEDDARRRLANDLHDGAQQRLVSLALQVRLASSNTTVVAAELADGISQIRADLDALTSESLPPLIAQRGLDGALRALAATTPLAVSLDLNLPATLPVELTRAAWFVINEALTNALKHAHATRVEISAAVTRQRLEVSVRDDGTGGVSAESTGSGLRGLRDRLTRLGGHLQIDSGPLIGTTVSADMPLAGVTS